MNRCRSMSGFCACFAVTALLFDCIELRQCFGQEGGGIAADNYCGAKCLYVLLASAGVGPDKYRDYVKELGSCGPDGYSMLELRDSARNNGLFAECVALDWDALIGLQPDVGVILHMDPGHFVIFGGLNKDSVTLYDASAGRSACRPKDVMDAWTGNAVLVAEQEIRLNTGATSSKAVFWMCLTVAFVSVALVCNWKTIRRLLPVGILLLVFMPGCSRRPAVAVVNDVRQEGATEIAWTGAVFPCKTVISMQGLSNER